MFHPETLGQFPSIPVPNSVKENNKERVQIKMMSMMSQILKKHFIKSGMGYSKWECIRGEWNGSSLFWMEWVIHSMHGRGVWIEMRSPPLPLPLCSSSLALMTKMMMCRTHPSQAHGCKWAAYLMQEMFNNAGSLGLTVPCHNAGLSGYYQAPSIHAPAFWHLLL